MGPLLPQELYWVQVTAISWTSRSKYYFKKNKGRIHNIQSGKLKWSNSLILILIIIIIIIILLLLLLLLERFKKRPMKDAK